MFKKLLLTGLLAGAVCFTAASDVFAGKRDRAGLVPQAKIVTPNSGGGPASQIRFATMVDVAAVTNDTDDFIVLPSLASVPVGYQIMILCNAGGAFELRTPSGSDEEINSEDCDETKEYLCTDTQVLRVVKISNTIGWMANAWSAIGTAVTAVVPD